ncbi:hypothetical protein Stsp01_37870 [Streptomyces sp. NBRC 13847]|nr:hypothetical protein Stsp01_37870 [Streptomyces sp. NBRC 13847]
MPGPGARRPATISPPPPPTVPLATALRRQTYLSAPAAPRPRVTALVCRGNGPRGRRESAVWDRLLRAGRSVGRESGRSTAPGRPDPSAYQSLFDEDEDEPVNLRTR